MEFNYCRKLLLVICILSLSWVSGVSAFGMNENINFNVDRNFDASARNQITATLIKVSDKINFYVEKSWWDSQLDAKKYEVMNSLDVLSQEFSLKIYPNLVSSFGQEWKPGIDGEDKITVLFEAINASEGGYFREADEYVKLQVPTSNEREMIYLSLDNITNVQMKKVLAHEFMHLITFNQKNRMYDIEEDTWLNEARADYASTFLGYDSRYDGSNLQQRVRDFIENPSDSITEWQGTKYDYASASLFIHYLVDHYGVGILADSLKSNYVGIESLDVALSRINSSENFNQIFTNWTIAVILNDCSVKKEYCYLDQNLVNFKLAPSINFLPVTGNVSLSVTNVTKNWSGNWLKFIGGNGDLRLEFSGLKGLNFFVPYIIGDNAGSYSVKFLMLDKNQKGQLSVNKFGTDYKSVIIIPTLQSGIYRVDDIEPTYPFTYSVEITGSAKTEDQELIQQLLDRIAYLKNEIAKILNKKSGQDKCLTFKNNLSYGLANNAEVSCLQEFLKNQGEDIYPEGLVTGNFGGLTKQAVIRFQAKYNIIQTGIVGPLTRFKINQILGGA